MRIAKLGDETIINIVAILSIGTLVATGLIVGATVPASSENINLVVSVGVTGIAGFARRTAPPENASQKPRE